MKMEPRSLSSRARHKIERDYERSRAQPLGKAANETGLNRHRLANINSKTKLPHRPVHAPAADASSTTSLPLPSPLPSLSLVSLGSEVHSPGHRAPSQTQMIPKTSPLPPVASVPRASDSGHNALSSDSQIPATTSTGSTHLSETSTKMSCQTPSTIALTRMDKTKSSLTSQHSGFFRPPLVQRRVTEEDGGLRSTLSPLSRDRESHDHDLVRNAHKQSPNDDLVRNAHTRNHNDYSVRNAHMRNHNDGLVRNAHRHQIQITHDLGNNVTTVSNTHPFQSSKHEQEEKAQGNSKDRKDPSKSTVGSLLLPPESSLSLTRSAVLPLQSNSPVLVPSAVPSTSTTLITSGSFVPSTSSPTSRSGLSTTRSFRVNPWPPKSSPSGLLRVPFKRAAVVEEIDPAFRRYKKPLNGFERRLERERWWGSHGFMNQQVDEKADRCHTLKRCTTPEPEVEWTDEDDSDAEGEREREAQMEWRLERERERQ